MPHMDRHWKPACIYSSLQIQRDLLVSRDSSDRNTQGSSSDASSSSMDGSFL
jgi:hypothetical protein